MWRGEGPGNQESLSIPEEHGGCPDQETHSIVHSLQEQACSGHQPDGGLQPEQSLVSCPHEGRKGKREAEPLAIFKGCDPQRGNAPPMVRALLRGVWKGP